MMKEFSANDPVKSLLEKIIVSLQHDGYVNGVLEEYDGHQMFSPIKQLSRFRDSYRSAPGNNSLDYIVSNFSTFEYTFEAALLIFEKAVAEAKLYNRTGPTAEILETYREYYGLLKSGIKALAPSHIALQAHFYSFVVESPTTWTPRDKLNEFFEPLYELRAEYFASSRRGLLQEYLRMSREMIESAYYEYAVTVDSDPTEFAKNQASIASKEVELEVFALMESVV